MNWLYKPGNFPIRKVELANKLENQESRELQQVAANTLNGGFFSLDVEQFRANLLARLPWIKTVAVRKVWPNKLLLSITEHKPVVRWLTLKKDQQIHEVQSAGEFELLSDEGIIFRPEFTEKQQLKFNRLALLTGPENSARKVLRICLQIHDNLKQLNAGIKRCGMNERRTWMLVLNNDIEIKLGKENIMRRLKRLIGVFSEQLQHYTGLVDYADLRYSNGFSIKWNSANATHTNSSAN